MEGMPINCIRAEDSDLQQSRVVFLSNWKNGTNVILTRENDQAVTLGGFVISDDITICHFSIIYNNVEEARNVWDGCRKVKVRNVTVRLNSGQKIELKIL